MQNIVCGYDTHQQNHTADFCVEVQLTSLDDNIARQYVIQYHVFDEVVAIVLFIIVLLDIEQGDCQDVGILCSSIIHALNEHGILRLCTGAERLIGIAVTDENIVYIAEIQRNELVGRSHLGEIAAGDDGCGIIYHTNRCVDGIPHLVNQSLK